MPSFIQKLFRRGTPNVSGAAEQSTPAVRGSSSSRAGSKLSVLVGLQPKPPKPPFESSVVSDAPHRTLLELMHEERPTDFTAHYREVLCASHILAVHPWNTLLHELKRSNPDAAYGALLAAAASTGPLAHLPSHVAREIRALRQAPTWSDVRCRLKRQVGLDGLTLQGVARMSKIAGALGISNRAWVREATTKGVFDPEFAKQMFEQAERYVTLLEADPVLRSLRERSQSRWSHKERQQAVKALEQCINASSGFRCQIRYAGEPSVANEGSKMKTYNGSSKIDVFDSAFNNGFLTLVEGVLHESIHVRQHKKGFDLDTQELLRQSPEPTSRYDATLGLIESMAYRSGLIAAFSMVRRESPDSFLGRVAQKFASTPQDPWVLLRAELAEAVGRDLEGLVSVKEGRIEVRKDAAEIFEAVSDACSKGDHANHGRLIAKALWGMWPDATKVLGEHHRDSAKLGDFERTLDAACSGKLDRSGLLLLKRKYGLDEGIIRAADEKGTLGEGLKLLGDLSKLEMLRVRHALECVLGQDGIVKYETELGLRPSGQNLQSY